MKRCAYVATQLTGYAKFIVRSAVITLCGQPLLSKFDDILCQGLNTISNYDLTDDHWMQVPLPIHAGELGLRREHVDTFRHFCIGCINTRTLR